MNRFKLFSKRTTVFWGLWLLFGFGIGISFLEVGLFALIHRPELVRKLPEPFIEHFRDLYSGATRDIIQFNPMFSRFDDELFYLLRTGSFVFSNIEFDSLFFVNKLGVRDDWFAFKNPEIVFVGDSRTMGWGVDQQQTFPYLMKIKTGKRTLNLGVSSFGTVREMRMLARLDLSTVKQIVIQYCDNDFEENKQFLENGNTHKSGGIELYQDAVAKNDRQKRYFFPKYSYKTIKKILVNLLSQKTTLARDFELEAKLFLNALMHAAKVNFEGIQITVLELNGYNENDNKFAIALGKEIRFEKYPAYIKNIQVVDPSSVLTNDHYYSLDDHMNAAGHEALTKYLITHK